MNTRSNFSTQEMTTQASQSRYSSLAETQDQLPPSCWSSLEFAHGQRLIRLRQPTVIVGRSLNGSSTNSTQLEHFGESDLRSRSDYMRTSCKYFTIERMLHDPVTGFEFNENAAPAIITCNGRNGFQVGEEFLNQNEKIVLAHDAELRLPKTANLLGTFKYALGVGHPLPHCSLMDDYFVGQEIGSGGNGSIRIIIQREKLSDQQHYELKALKSISYGGSLMARNSLATLTAVKNEARIMKSVNHTHVMGLFSEYITDQHVHLVVELMCGGDLLNRIQSSQGKRLTEADSKFFFTQVLSGIRYLHDKGITHRDIKVDNILLKDNGSSPLAKIADFGLSKMQVFMNTVCGTFIYSAPEIFRKTIYTNKVDIWSVGIMLYCMLTGKVPFSFDKNRETEEAFYQKICLGVYSTKYFDKLKISDSAARILEFMIQPSPQNRLKAEELQRLSWLNESRNHQRIAKMYQMYGIKQDDPANNLPARLEESLVLDEERARRNRLEDGASNSELRAKRPRIAH